MPAGGPKHPQTPAELAPARAIATVRRMLRALFAVLAGLVSASELTACALRPAPQAPTPVREPAAARPAASPAPTPAPQPVARLPLLDHEPVLGVLIARAPRVALELRAQAELVAGSMRSALAQGTHTFEARGGALVLGGESWREPVTLASGGEPRFALDAIPKFGAPRRLTLAGDLLLRADGNELEVIERVPMEAYLASVVGAEMNAKWPPAALAAQAIVARSYAAARWMEKSSEPWQLHWHFGVDMAYHGWSESNATVARAIASTRGEVLVHAGFPVLALFHASSGGRTESFERIKPGVFAPDGKTPIAAAMPVVTDDAALLGAEGLKLAATHGCWKADLPLPDVGAALQKWSSEDRSRPRLGTLEAVSVAARHADSGRVKSVSLRHALDGQTRFTELVATDFRMAVSPVKIRSLFWDRCVIAAKEPGFLVLEGRGFGHGCGLSQVSAWYLATQGESPERIVARFYAGAKIERRY
jgi:peptidoglycan hydrolase-like amidase